MKNIFTLFIFSLFFSFSAFSQDYTVGLKAGVNIGHGGEIVGAPHLAYPGREHTSIYKEGFHGGIFMQLEMKQFFLRAEGLYNRIQTEFQFDRRPSTYSIDKISVPVLGGYHIYEPFDVYLGPGLSINNGNATLEDEQGNNGQIPIDDFYLSLNAGIKAHLGRFELDIRYEYNFQSNENFRITMGYTSNGIGPATFTNRRINQLMISASVGLFDSKYRPKKSKRKRGCYFR